MNEESAYELVDALSKMKAALYKQIEMQEEANRLMRSLIDSLQSNSQEMLDLQMFLRKSKSD